MAENLFLAPCSRTHKENTYRHFERTVASPITSEEYPDLGRQGYESARVWGVVSGNRSSWERMSPGDIVLFYTKTKVYTHAARVLEIDQNENLSEQIWNTYDEGRLVQDLDEPWQYMFYLDNTRKVDVPSPEFHADMGWASYYPQGFTRVSDSSQQQLINEYGSLTAAVRYFAKHESIPDYEEYEDRTSELLEVEEEEPILTVDNEESEYTEETRRIRSAAFRKAVREAYHETCAICGAQRYTPAGNPEVEAAHVYPKSENGRDDVRNGLALCRMHHWAFDTGWLGGTDDHEILVRHEPGTEAFGHMQPLHGERLVLPDNERHHPHPLYLEAHRELHGFDN